MYTVTIKGFKTRWAAESFADWYSYDSNEDLAEWWHANGDSHVGETPYFKLGSKVISEDGNVEFEVHN